MTCYDSYTFSARPDVSRALPARAQCPTAHLTVCPRSRTHAFRPQKRRNPVIDWVSRPCIRNGRIPCVYRPCGYLFGILVFFNRALSPSHFHSMITAGTDEFGIMRDYQNGSAASCCLFQFLCNQPHVLSIKTTGWFVKDQNPAFRKDRAGDG